MRYTKVMGIAATMVLMGVVPGFAQQKIYAYGGSHNFCPAGLQPVTINGEICCGQPTETIGYQQALAHGVRHKNHVRQSSKVDCPVGAKGCTFD